MGERRDNTDLKQYISSEINRLAVSVNKQEGLLTSIQAQINNIEVRYAERNAEMQRDITHLIESHKRSEEDIVALRHSIDQEESTRQFLSNENRQLISNLSKEQADKWSLQIKQNESLTKDMTSVTDSIKSLRNAVWAVIMVVGSSVFVYFFNLLTGR